MTWGLYAVRQSALAAVAVVTLLTTAIAPAAQAAMQPGLKGKVEDLQPGLGLGHATTRIALARINLRNINDRGQIPATLGEIIASVDTTIARPLSALRLTGVQADDRKAVEWERNNLSPDPVGTKDGVPDVNRSGVQTKMALGGWGATAPDRERAVAQLAVLEGQLDSNKVGVNASLGERGFISALAPDGANSRASLTLDGFDINLGALLPVDLVGLPFGMSYRITEELELPMPDDVQQGVDQFTSVLAQMQLVESALAIADEAEARAAARLAATPGTTASLDEQALAEAALAAALADVTGATTAVADAEAALAAALTDEPDTAQAVAAAEAQLAAAQQALATAAAELAQAQQATDAAAAEVAATQAELDALLAQAAADPVQAVLLAADIAAKQTELVAAQAELTAAQAAQADEEDANAAAAAAVTDAEAALIAAQGGVSDAVTTARAARDAARAALNAVKAVADAARDRLATAQLAYDAAMAAAAETDEVLAGLLVDAQAMKAKLAVLFLELGTLLDALPDLLGLHESLLDALEATPVLKIGALHLTSEASADAAGGRTFTECFLSGIEVLGKPMPTVTCEDLAATRESIEGRIEEFLALLAGRPVNGVLIEGPVATTEATQVPDARGFHSAKVHFTPLRVEIPTAGIAMTWDATHARLAGITGALLDRADLRTMPEFADVPSVPLAEVPMMALGVPTGGRVRVQSGGGYRIADEPDPVAQKLEALRSQAEQTPPGSPVHGDTPGLDAELGGLDNEATFRPAGAGTGGNVPGGGNGTGGSGGNGTGGSGGNGTGGSGGNGADGDGSGGNGSGGNGSGGNGSGGNGSGGNGSDGDADGLPGSGSDHVGLPGIGVDLPHTGGGASAALVGIGLVAVGGLGLRRRR